MAELKVGSKVKALKSNMRVGCYEGKLGIVQRDDGDFRGNKAYLVSFGEGQWGWFLSHELEIEEIK